MLTLCIDTSNSYLTCALIVDDEIISNIFVPCFKRQSEELFPVLKEVFDKVKINPATIDSICVSVGPGSYTGTRIAMTLAKTIGEMLPCDVYTISSLRLYAGGNPNTMVIMNARANRAYVGVYDNNEIIVDDHIEMLDEIDPKDYNIVGDGLLIDKMDNYPDIPLAFLKTKPVWKKEEDIAYLVPMYLKESESYYR